MRTQTQRRRITVAIVLLALAAASVLWVAFTMDSKGNAGIALDGSGSGSVKSGLRKSGSVGTDPAESDSTGPDSSGPDSSKSGSPKSQADHSGSTESRTTDTGSTDSGSTASGSTGSRTAGNTSSNSSTSSGDTGSGPAGSSHGSGSHAGDHGTGNGTGNGGGHTDPPAPANGLSVRVGTVGALFPGAHTTAPVTVTNQTSGDLGLTEIRVSSPGTNGCGSSYLYLGHRTLGHSLTIRGHGQVGTKVRFGLRASAPDSCKGKTIPFSVNVRAVSR
jgi:hypothetical protein